ncbi:NADH-quinone oxidoreductase subunit C [Natronocella acetinitrilica]|uniref:NADH-quinone oxidoreductase subunit C n=1 Tax=Natronocella acetinitrilica TaxID=414046 RepID=A0AAE3G2S1_9GAMM|nr:NADH-quinone oxidoreductase subunit C [Natronocella acetinitrilica]MCP1674731.1 NADH-quinone oxidoreductase subunit C [Natronocella acetinitrilica]
MSEKQEQLLEGLRARFGDRLTGAETGVDMAAIEVAPDQLYDVLKELSDNPDCRFEQLTDLCGVDYAAYGEGEWITEQASGSGFSRGVRGNSFARLGLTGIYGVDEIKTNTGRRFAVVYHLLSMSSNERLRVRTYCEDDNFPVVDSVVSIWAGANWFEREAFDLYGIVFDGHPDLRRLLTDYGFVGHPFRKDFPLIGNVEVRYNEEKGRVVYEPVSIQPRVLVPRVVRDDSRYADHNPREGADNG